MTDRRAIVETREEGLGFDAVARDVDGQDVRFLLARRVDADSKIWLRASEWAQVQRLGERVLIYAEQGEKVVTLSAREAAVAATADDWNRRVFVGIGGLQLPLVVVCDVRSEA
jgi:hypothetical protein